MDSEILGINIKRFGYKPCKSCNGKGKIERYPYFAIKMPKKEKMDCKECHGSGQVYIVPNNSRILKENEY